MSVSFNAATPFAVGRNSNSVAVADVNGDGNFDVVTGGTTSSSPSTTGISTLLGNGAGSFGTAVTSSGQFGAANALALGDFNNDGKLDVITTGAQSGGSASDVFVALGDGKGNFTPTSSLIVGGNPQKVAVGDVNGDGFLDAVTANSGSRNLSILLGDGKGGLKASNITLEGNPKAIALKDFNGDGRLDIAAVTVASDLSTSGGAGKLVILAGNGAGSFTPTATVNLGGTSPYGASDIVTGDFDGDSRVDIAALAGSKIFALTNPGGQGYKLVYQTEQNANGLTSGDFNGDGQLDLATSTAGYGGTNATVLLGNGNSNLSFTRAVSFLTGGSNAFGNAGIAASDFNKDGKLDLASVNSSYTDASVLLNNTTETDAIAQGPTTSNGKTIGFIDASSETGPVNADLGKGTFVLQSATPINKSTTGVDDIIGTVQKDKIVGNNNANFLNGLAGDDKLTGGKGDDRLVGGAGRDDLTGGAGKDRFIVSGTPNYPEGLESAFSKNLVGVDRILDFESGKDKIVLDAGTFTALKAGQKVKFNVVDDAAEAKLAKGIITYVRDTGNLYYNANGAQSGFGNGGKFAEVTDGLQLKAKDFSALA